MPEPQATPSTWRIVRTYLSVRESASHKDILRAIKVHRPLMSNPQYHSKMAQFENNGLIGHKSRAHLYLTQKGREYVTDPNDPIGLPTWVPPAAIRTDAIVEVTSTKATVPYYHSKEHMAKMLAARKAKAQAAKVNARGPNKKVRSFEELKATRELRARLRAARHSQESEINAPFSTQRVPERPAKPAMITIAGVPTKVDDELIERLLSTKRELQTAVNLPDIPMGQIIDLPIGIRLKISVEVV